MNMWRCLVWVAAVKYSHCSLEIVHSHQLRYRFVYCCFPKLMNGAKVQGGSHQQIGFNVKYRNDNIYIKSTGGWMSVWRGGGNRIRSHCSNKMCWFFRNRGKWKQLARRRRYRPTRRERESEGESRAYELPTSSWKMKINRKFVYTIVLYCERERWKALGALGAVFVSGCHAMRLSYFRYSWTYE